MHLKSADKYNRLNELAREIADCKECRNNKVGVAVAGEGNPDARVFLVGEAPGPAESKIGKPFTGSRSGEFLDKLLFEIGLKREDVFIASPVKFYPGKRLLKEGEVKHGSEHLRKQIEAVRPRVVVLMGNTAHKGTVGRVNLAERHGKAVEIEGIIYFSTFHPSAARRFPEVGKMMKGDFRNLRKLLDELG